ncbi:MAG: ribose 5-phosphate isomerase [Solirubrobacterales bacterium]|jgi:ribose 5-phosphate isomerase B|nr:ribose 5-phosphate isomerase [Solirubrobacterales bacterium]
MVAREMKVVVGSDHAGYLLKQEIAPRIAAWGHEVFDVGTDSEDSTDYPRYAAAAARMVSSGEVDRAVVICGSGVGVCIVANKIDGVRAVNAHDTEEAMISRHHNDTNVLALAGRRLNRNSAAAIVERFLETDFEGGRHEARIAQIGEVEQGGQP